tara:strand:+ start:892 stop:1032 length:141 start_codon:yes stop_codon:yes gene_type:complete
MPIIWKGNRRINVPADSAPHWENTVKQNPAPVEVEVQPAAKLKEED